MGRWLRTLIVDRKQVSADGTETVDLPKANFLGSITLRIANVSGTTPTNNATKIEVIANGSSVVWSVDGDQFSRQSQYHYGVEVGTDFDGLTTGASIGKAFFGRHDKDTFVVFPAKLFRTLQLKVTFDVGGTTPVYDYSVIADEWISDDDPLAKLVMKTVEIEQKASGSGVRDFDLPLGNIYKQFQLFVGTVPSSSTIKYVASVRINGGAEIPYTQDYELGTEENQMTKNLAAEMANDLIIDFDYDLSLADTKDSSQYNDFKVRLDSGTNSTTAKLITTELVRLK